MNSKTTTAVLILLAELYMTDVQFLDEIQKCQKEIFEKSRFAFCTAGIAPTDQSVIDNRNKMADLKEFVIPNGTVFPFCK